VALNIKNERAQELAREVAEMTGESQTTAVIVALEERKERLKIRNRREKWLAIGAENAKRYGNTFNSQSIDDLLYDESGLPK
jgi:antitoxin VapB